MAINLRVAHCISRHPFVAIFGTKSCLVADPEFISKRMVCGVCLGCLFCRKMRVGDRCIATLPGFTTQFMGFIEFLG